MLKKLIGNLCAEGKEAHLASALDALEKGNREIAEKEIASYLIVAKAEDGPLNWISHPEYLSANTVKVSPNKVTGEVLYRGETHEIQIEIG